MTVKRLTSCVQMIASGEALLFADCSDQQEEKLSPWINGAVYQSSTPSGNKSIYFCYITVRDVCPFRVWQLPSPVIWITLSSHVGGGVSADALFLPPPCYCRRYERATLHRPPPPCRQLKHCSCRLRPLAVYLPHFLFVLETFSPPHQASLFSSAFHYHTHSTVLLFFPSPFLFLLSVFFQIVMLYFFQLCGFPFSFSWLDWH